MLSVFQHNFTIIQPLPNAYFKTFFIFFVFAVKTKKLIMKLVLFAAIVMFKCSRLSSAPADSSTETGLKNNSENDFSLNQPGYVVAQHPNGLSYVSNDEDLGTTGVLFQFRRSIKSDNTEIEARRRSALDKGFMRFGRGGKNMMRFGRSPPIDEAGDDSAPMRKRKNDIVRFGRAGNMMRFGRSFSGDYDGEDYNDAAEMDDYANGHQWKNTPENNLTGSKIIRYGRSSESESDETIDDVQSSPERSEKRNGYDSKKNDKHSNIVRFGRAGNMMRFGRGNVMRFGKRGNMLRFGRAGNVPPKKIYKAPMSFFENRVIRGNNERNLLRLGRAGNLIRFGRNEKNLMRFGKRGGPQAISSSTRVLCEDDECLVQEHNNQLTENGENDVVKTSDQLHELFGNDAASKQGYGEYVYEKK
jgi:hypothetical protein